MTKYILIGIVLREELTGYDIKKEVEMGIGNFYKASYGSLYPALKRLTEQGVLNMREEPQGGRIKKYYKATERGREEFLEWLSTPYDPNNSEEQPLVKVYFFGELSPDTRRKRLEEYENYTSLMLHQLEQMEKQYAGEELNDRHYFELSTLYYGIRNGYETLKWFRHLKERRPHPEFLSEKE